MRRPPGLGHPPGDYSPLHHRLQALLALAVHWCTDRVDSVIPRRILRTPRCNEYWDHRLPRYLVRYAERGRAAYWGRVRRDLTFDRRRATLDSIQARQQQNIREHRGDHTRASPPNSPPPKKENP